MFEPRILRLPEVKHRTGLSKASIYRQIATGDMPPPIRLGPRAVGWRLADIDAWLASRPTALCRGDRPAA